MNKYRKTRPIIFFTLFYIFIPFQTVKSLSLSSLNSMPDNSSFNELCYNEKKCRPHSLKVLKDYQSGQKMNLNFSKRHYTGVCDHYFSSVFSPASILNLYIKKEKEHYYAHPLFGYLSEGQKITPKIYHSKEYALKNLNSFQANETNQILETNEFHYMYVPYDENTPRSPPFFAWMRSSNQSSNYIQIYGFFGWGMFVCDAHLNYEVK